MIRRIDVLRASSASIALAIATIATPASAQSNLPPPDITQSSPASTNAAPASGGEIVVTGSRIRRDPLSQDSPIVFIDQQDIAKTGLTSINDVLQRLPSSGGGLNGRFNNSGNLGNPPDGGGVGAGSAEIDLRYLGSRRVLVLVDGLRFVNGASASGVPGSTDLNSIPAAAIERVEVLQDGASAIYGSDAIAGVVNIITKQRQKGFDASAQVGSYLDHNDGWNQTYQLSWGNGTSGPTQIVIGANFVKSDGVLSGDRAISAFPSPYSTTCLDGGCSSFPLTGRFGLVGLPLLTLNKPVTGRPTYPTDFRNFTTADRFNFAPYNYLETPLKRLGVFTRFTTEIGRDTHFQVKGLWNKRTSANQAAPLPLGIGPDVGNGNLLDQITVSATNPYNPFGVDLVPGVNYNEIKRRLIELGPRRYEQTVKTLYAVASVDGKLPINGDWFWDVNLSYGSNRAKQTMFGNVNALRLQQALGPVSQCTGACVPFDFFGTPGAITSAMLNFVAFNQHDSSKQTTWDWTANLSGHLFELPGGPLGLAMGMEYRDLRGRFDPDPIVAAGFGSDIPAQPTRGGYNVLEAYAELNAPLVKDVPFAQLLELNGAVRLFDYSTSGSDSTLKAGINWKPIRDLRLRGTWAQGFRAPSIGELFGSLSRFDSAIDDPCSINSAQAQRFSNSSTVRSNCTAQGAPAGSTTAPTDQLSVITGGNDKLKPETSRSWVLGAVYSPGFFPRFSIEANWYDIKVKGAIQAISATTTLYRCVYQNDPLSCANVTRSGTGNVTAIRGTLQNIAAIRTQGIDLNLTYRTAPAAWGRLGFTWNNNFLHKFDVTTPTASGNVVDHRAGTEQGSPSQAYPKWKSIGSIDWDHGGFGATLTGRYVSRVHEVLNNDSPLNSVFYTDAQLRFTPRVIGREFGFALGVNNLFNTRTPGCVSCDINNMDPTTYDTPGRYYYARVGVKF